MSDSPLGPGYWQASDGKWYPPEQAPGATPPPGPAYGAPGVGAPAYGAPGYGGQPGGGIPGVPGPLATFGQRAGAYLLDSAIILVAFIGIAIVGAILGAVADVLGALVFGVGYLAMLAYGIYIFAMQGKNGATPAKRIMGLKVVAEATGQPIGAGLGIVRQLAHFVDSIACYVGWLFPLWDEKRQTFADKIMSTVVLSDQPKESFGPDIFKM